MLLFNVFFYQQVVQLLQESPFGRFDVIENPEPIAPLTKSTLIGFACSRRFLSIRYVTPLSLITSSFSAGSSRAIPSEGPDQPPSERKSLIYDGSSWAFRKSVIFSFAVSVTVNISNASFWIK